ncbi:membrane protein [Blastocystis sp. ATCC 50177/Nand II]|uniref:Membrane protein n=1 Tax=Blastocystis sp. subtype 1 (strain ATCC 50177 / NandII) TaxID=478820 RepID=A0A196SC56_BLAHN|nr:membrane protein [Blastocystis sp. ATCC 50177/Nand II]
MSERHIPLLPSRSSNDSEQYVEVEMPMMTIWQKIEVYLEMITVPLIIVGVVVVGFVVRFFREIIIPTILALFLFQISKPIVLRLHKPIIPYFAFEYPELSEEEKRLIQQFFQRDFKLYVRHASELINSTAEWLNDTCGIDLNEELVAMSKKINLSAIIEGLYKGLSKILVCLGFTILIYMFLLFGSSMRIFNKDSLRYKVENQITNYLIIKTILSFILALSIYIVFGPILRIPMAMIFALMFFALNYIPHIGPIIAVCVPIPLILFDPRSNIIRVIVAIAFPCFMNVLLQDFVEPKVLGDSLHLHPIVVIVCLVVWALLLGPIGTVFAVPLTACVKILTHNVDLPFMKIVDAWLSGDFCCVHIHDHEGRESTVVV